MRLFLANLSETCLTGLCPFFVRTKIDVPVNIKNIHEVRYSMEDLRKVEISELKD